MEELERKYIELIINKCFDFKKSKSLLINCDFKEHIGFAEKIKKYCNSIGILDVCIHVNDLDEIHNYLKNTDLDDIKLNPLIDRTPWNEFAINKEPILFLSSTVPGLMDDIEVEKIEKWVKEREKSTTYYRQNVSRHNFPWSIVAVPNERWAKLIFGDTEDAYEKLYLNIMKMCMVDKDNPVLEWDKYIEQSNYYKEILNSLDISKLHYINSLGTDLYIELPSDNIWMNAYRDTICNMPSYEVYTSPDYRKTNGVVYSSRPLYYNDCLIDNFIMEFSNGEVVNVSAKEGQNILEKLVFGIENMNKLGEVALVPYDSPISNTGLVFNTTLFDENASCHFAIGRGFPGSIKSGNLLKKEELLKRGINQSVGHTDFMIGTKDLNIEAETNKGKVLIFKNGNFNI